VSGRSLIAECVVRRISPPVADSGKRRAIFYDESTYPAPYTFDPERYLKNGKLDHSIKDPGDTVFGFGRRCEYCFLIPLARSSSDFTSAVPDLLYGNFLAGSVLADISPCEPCSSTSPVFLRSLKSRLRWARSWRVNSSREALSGE
jgi:hypothetical protein